MCATGLDNDRRYAINYSKAARELGYSPARATSLLALRATLGLVFGATCRVGGKGCWGATMRPGCRRITSTDIVRVVG